jgi:O-antigen/teichoic acid export membrane protein
MATKEQQIKNSFIYLLPVGLANLIPLITLPIFTRVLTKEDYGIFALAQIYAIFANGLVNFGLPIGYERNFFQYRDREKASELLYSTLLFVITSFLICAFLTYLFRSPFSKWIIGSSDHANLLFWAFFSAGIVSLKSYYLIYFKNTEDAKSLVWYNIGESFMGVVLSLFLVVYLRVGVIGLVWGQLFGSLFVFSVLVVKFVKLFPVSFNWPILKESLKLSYPLTPRIFFGVIGNQFDKYMIRLLASVGGVGIYSIGQNVASLVFAYMTAIQNVFSPQVFKKMFDLGEKGGEAVGRYLTPFAYICISVALMISLFGEEVITILTPKSFHGAIDILIILTMYYGFMFFGKQPQLIFTKKTHMTSFLTVVSILLNIGINIPFIMRWGAIGAAWGTLLSGMISGSISFVVSQYYYKIEWEYKKIGAIFFISFSSAISMILLRNMSVDYAIRLIVKCVFIISYVYLGIKIGVITTENLLLVKKIFRLKGASLFPQQ